MGQSHAHILHDLLPELWVATQWRSLIPAQSTAWNLLGQGQPPITGGFFQTAAQACPVDQSTRHLQSGDQHITPQVDQLGARQVFAQKRHTRFIQLVRLIKNDYPGRRL